MSAVNDNSTPPLLLPCAICNRTFKPESLAKHVKVCEKTLMRKRKKFDSSRQRLQGTELAEFLPLLSKSVKVDKSPSRKSSLDTPWKDKHLQLMETIQAARQIPSDGVHLENLRGRIRRLTDQEVCPYCERSFGIKAYDRHVEWCKDKITRAPPKSSTSVVAKERLEARTKYQAPRLRQSLRARTREKYSPHRHKQSQEKKPDSADAPIRKESFTATNKELSAIANNKGTATSKLHSPVTKMKSVEKFNTTNNKSAVNIPVQPPVKRSSTSVRLGTQSIKKLDPPSTNVTRTPVKSLQKQSSSVTETQVVRSDATDYDPYTSAQQQMKELLGLDFDKKFPTIKDLPLPLFNPIPLKCELKPEFPADELLNDIKSSTTTNAEIPELNNFVDEKNSLNNSLSAANVGRKKSIESQFVESKIENIIETSSDEELTVPIKDLVIKNTIETDLKRTPVSIGCSPTSAFAKYSPSPPHIVTEIAAKSTPNLPLNVPLDEVSNFSNYSKSETNVEKYPRVNMSSISLCSTVSIDSNVDFNKNKRGSNDNSFIPEINSKLIKNTETHKEGRNICRTLLNMEQMLFGVSPNSISKKSKVDNKNTNVEANKNLTRKNEETASKVNKSIANYNQLYPKLNLDSTDAAELELIESISELENLYLFSPISQDPSLSLNTSYSKTDPSSVMAGSGEGLRKEKKETQSVPSSQPRKPSSDSAYSSLSRKSPLTRPLANHQVDLAGIKSPSSLSSSGSESSVAHACRTERRLSTFCHECGAKYPVSIAKFCCECGVRRLALA